jgi:streptogramin lyase
VETGFAIDSLTATRDHVWIAGVIAGAIVHIDPHTLRVGPAVEIEGSVEQLEARGDTLWTLDPRDGTVTRLDVDSGEETGSARVGGTPTDMTVAEDAVWVGDLDGSLYRVDPLTLEVTTVSVGAEIFGVAVNDADGSLWVYAGGPPGG